MPSGQTCVILGLAREGASLARFLAARGNRVIVTDSAPPERLQGRIDQLRDIDVSLVLGGQYPDLIERADVLYVSPGVPETNPVFGAARERGIPIGSMTTLFFQLCPGPILGITGSSGKTTTTRLIGDILHVAEADVVVGGNIGDPMIDLLPHISPTTTVVLELSSFQLSLLDMSPHIAVVTNISPNHLDRHDTMESYIEAKQQIVRHQSADDFAVLNSSDGYARSFADSTPGTVHWFGETGRERAGACIRGDTIVLHNDEKFVPVMAVGDVPLLGRHNIENVLAACSATAILGVSASTISHAVRSFRPPPHRLQTVGIHAGVRFVDDSIATTPDRATVALEALNEPLLLIAGGRDKHLPWNNFARLIVERTRALFLIGEAAGLIEDAVRGAMQQHPGTLPADAIYRCATLDQAVIQAAATARPGDVVLLSPACTSYDMFHDYAERGARFVQALERLYAA
ncbi:MAG: UDP-N-acetylmuramoyl-L-alanine--D-glutamate ligase [Chloroflexota bacterium]